MVQVPSRHARERCRDPVGAALREPSAVRNLWPHVLVYRGMGTAAEEAEAVGAADPGAAHLASLYEAYWSSLLRTAWMMTGSKDEAEDIVHDAFVRLASGDPVPRAPARLPAPGRGQPIAGPPAPGDGPAALPPGVKLPGPGCRGLPGLVIVPEAAGPPTPGARAPLPRRPDARRSLRAARLPARDHQVPGPPRPGAPQEGDGRRWLS